MLPPLWRHFTLLFRIKKVHKEAVLQFGGFCPAMDCVVYDAFIPWALGVTYCCLSTSLYLTSLLRWCCHIPIPHSSAFDYKATHENFEGSCSTVWRILAGHGLCRL